MFDAMRKLISRTIGAFKRTAVCAACGKKTAQTRHGYTADGELWKGHVCECGGWCCQSCGAVLGKARQCCR